MDLIEVYVGEIRLDGKVDITDPCYDKGTWCRMTTECEPGYYTGYAYISDEGEWGKRIAELSIYKNDVKVEPDDMEFIDTIGVDAGLAGFFRDKPDYGEGWMDFLVESGVFKNKEKYDYDKNTYAIDYGIFSESGYGDGCYAVYANETRSAFTIVFIEDEEDEEVDE